MVAVSCCGCWRWPQDLRLQCSQRCRIICSNAPATSHFWTHVCLMHAGRVVLVGGLRCQVLCCEGSVAVGMWVWLVQLHLVCCSPWHKPTRAPCSLVVLLLRAGCCAHAARAAAAAVAAASGAQALVPPWQWHHDQKLCVTSASLEGASLAIASDGAAAVWMASWLLDGVRWWLYWVNATHRGTIAQNLAMR